MLEKPDLKGHTQKKCQCISVNLRWNSTGEFTGFSPGAGILYYLVYVSGNEKQNIFKLLIMSNALVCARSCLTLQTYGLYPTETPLSKGFSGKNTGVGCHFLLQGIILMQVLKLHLLHWQADSFTTEQLGKPDHM